ncbi:MAG: ATP-binding cassette domain-containing protein [Actinomycetaceae bacterium]|nr:ATP-binding cassette domain-containing protein [Actinomycetaceae bacterium]
MIQFESVTKIYPDGTAAVSDFSLTVPSHRTVALVGSSGSGKTTLLRMVNRMVDPTSGRVLIDDEDVLDRDPVVLRRSIGYVLQNGGLLPHRTVLDNIATVPVLTGRPRKKARAEAKELLERVGLDPSLGDRYPAQLSGGQQQRVGVARALALDPNILLMDEPFGAVDPIVRGELQDELVRLQAELGKTIVFVTHDIEEAFRLGDEVVVLKEGGEIAQRGTPAEILASPADDFVRDFVGLGRADLHLQVREVEGRAMVVDPDGRPLGFLEGASRDDADAGRESGLGRPGGPEGRTTGAATGAPAAATPPATAADTDSPGDRSAGRDA